VVYFKKSCLRMAGHVEVVGDGFEIDEETTFLFTSESVGEGHPGESPIPCWAWF